jgi:hypothetical protein
MPNFPQVRVNFATAFNDANTGMKDSKFSSDQSKGGWPGRHHGVRAYLDTYYGYQMISI